MKNYLYSTSQATAQAALDQINDNCGWPNVNTSGWAPLMQAYNQEIYFFKNVPLNGYTDNSESFNYEQMMNNVVGVEESDGDSSWFAPPSDDDQP